MAYRLVDRTGKPLVDPAVAGSYLLSPKDIKAIELLPALIGTGVKALKIEGRMKRPEYVAVVVRQYRQALDRLAGEKEFSVQEAEEKALHQVFNRGFAPAYLQGNPGRELMSYRRPNNRGSYLGRVKAYHAGTGTVRIALAESLRPGDGIEVWVTRGGRVATVVKKLWSGGKSCQEGRPGEAVSLELRGAISPGDRVFKTLDAALIASAWESFRRPVAKGQVPVTAKVWAVTGHPVEVEFRDAHGRKGRGVTVTSAQEARTNPLTSELVAKQLGRLGETPFKLVQVELLGDPAVMVPWSQLNAARRQAIAELESQRLAGWHRVTVEEVNWCRDLPALGLLNPEAPACPVGDHLGGPATDPVLTVAVEGLAGLRAVLAAGVREVYLGTEGYRHGQPFLPGEERAALDLCREAGAKAMIALPRLYRPEQKERVQATIDRWQVAGADSFLVGNLGYLELLAAQGQQAVAGIRTDFSLWVFNAQAAAFLTNLGVEGFTLSPELSLVQWHSLVNAGLPAAGMAARQAEVIVHGPMPMMISEYCATGALLGGIGTGKLCSGACRDHPEVFLEDRLKFRFPIFVDAYCRMHVMNAKELSLLGNLPAIVSLGVGRVRVEGRGKSPHWLQKVTTIYRQALAAIKTGAWEPEIGQKWKEELLRLHPAGYTKGHLFRGVD
ncbi:MAG: DUF3656 domain-containing protein [Heliobacteriaceae bacterium]|nr:DUF3656 domain-containing protein [Heliobacteriaceae bacterium]